MSQIKPKITGLIITLNEERNIKSVIENLHFVDKIIVLDSFSTDKTIKIIKTFPQVKLYQNKFKNFTDQRNLALTYAENDWILFLDADERITPELKTEILNEIEKPHTADAYFFKRKFKFKDKNLNFSGWQTDKNVRLFKKSKAIYTKERLVHEILSVNGSTKTLKNKLIHYSYLDYQSYKAKMISYAHLKAQELHQKSVKPNFYHFIIKPAYRFFHSYFIRLGILDGKKGIIICYLNALSVYHRYPELKRLNALPEKSTA
ncbi:MAG: glycosyltransferase family 2 protein [Psychroflexus halocasei]